MSEFVWHPTPEIVDQANVTRLMQRHGITSIDALMQRSVDEQEWFWQAIVDDLGIEFETPFTKVRDASQGIPWTDWYIGGQLNLTENCLAHAEGESDRNRICLVAEHEDGTVRSYSYHQFADLVRQCAASLRALGIGKGDRVGAYMPMSAEVAIQMFATIQIGAIFIPIFSGFAPAALAERLNDAGARILFTAAGSARRGKPLTIKPQADEAAAAVPSLEKVIVLQRGEVDVPWNEDMDLDWDAFLELGSGYPVAAEIVESMAPALILYTSGTTGRPKGTVHSHAGSLVQIAKEVGYAFDMKPADRFFWLTDIGWMMGPWMLIGGLFHRATVYLYEGAIDWPGPGRLWEMVQRHQISTLGISPTAIRLLQRSGDEVPANYDLQSLRILGSTGEPWDEDSWTWFFETIGRTRCPIINIAGGTDLIGCFLSPLPVQPIKPCSLVGPGLGMAVDVWNEEGSSIREEVGFLVATEPAPSMTRGLWNDRQRYLETYWSTWKDVWNHGDWAIIDEDGQWFLRGRADDTLNVAGKRLGPAEIEGVLIETGLVSEAAAIGIPHDVKGEAIVCFVVLRPPHEPSEAMTQDLIDAVARHLGKLGRPERVLYVEDLPKTRSAKILRRLIRSKYLGQEELGDLSSLQNPKALQAIHPER
jgi:acetyl-CoA synthetase